MSKDATDPLLPYFLANGNAFYYNLFMPAMMEEVKAEQRGKIQGSNAKKLQETIDVGTIGLARKHVYNYWQNFHRITQLMHARNKS